MRIAPVVLAALCSSAASAQCKKERALTKPEQAFFAKTKALAKALPAAPSGWELHPEEVAAPPKLCSDVDAMFKKGETRLNLVSETEYRDPADRSAKQEAASKQGAATADETKKLAELQKKGAKMDAGMALAAVQADQQKLAQAQIDRMNKAIHEAGLDAEARIRVSLNPESESSTGCGVQKSLAATKVDGATYAFTGTCDFSSNPQEPEAGVLLLFGGWSQKLDGATLEATPTYEPKKPHTVVQAISVVITGDGKRADELLKGVDVKAIAAMVGK